MKALISGQAGVAVVLGEKPQFRPIEGEAYFGTEAEVVMTFAGFSDVETIEVETLRALDRRLGQTFAEDRAKFLLFMLLDGAQDADERREIAEEIERLVRHHRVKGAVTLQLAKVSTDEDDLERAQVLADELPGIAPLLAALYPGVEAAEDRVLVQLDGVSSELRPLTFKFPAGLTFPPNTHVHIKKDHARPIQTRSVTASYPDKIQKRLETIVNEARASLASDKQKTQRSIPRRFGYVGSIEFERAVARAWRIFAAELKQADVKLAPPRRTEIAAMIRAGSRNSRVGKVAVRKFGGKVAHVARM